MECDNAGQLKAAWTIAIHSAAIQNHTLCIVFSSQSRLTYTNRPTHDSLKQEKSVYKNELGHISKISLSFQNLLMKTQSSLHTDIKQWK